MIISIMTQVNLILFSLLAGAITGVLFDFYRIIRGFEVYNKILTFIQDLLFWIFTSLVVFVFLLLTNHAYMGAYVYLYIFIGIYLYMKIFSKVLIRIEFKMITCILKIVRIIKNTVIYPFQLIIYYIKTKNK